MANNNLIASDSFTSGSLAAGWSAAFLGSGFSQITGGSPHLAEPTAADGNAYGQVWTGPPSFGRGQISEVTLSNFSSEAGTFLYLLVRADGSGNSYAVKVGNGQAALLRFDAGVATSLGTTSVTVSNGDVWIFAISGSVMTVYQNGLRISYVGDATYPSGGGPGFLQTSSVAVTHLQVASWRGYSSQQQDG